MAFYKYEQEELFCGPNFVESDDYRLVKEEHQTYTYPVFGWYWFETYEEAKIFFNIKE